MPLVKAGESLQIPAKYSSVKVANESMSKNGACNIVFDSGTQNVQIPAGQSKTVDLHKNEAELDNTGSTDLEVTLNP